MKRQLVRLAAVSMVVMTVLGACNREEKKKVDKIKWKVENGTLTISGKGEIEDKIYGEPENAWDKYRESIHTIVFENGITSIGYFAFRYYNNLTSITIPESIITIKDYAFSKCYRLQTVNYNAINCTRMYGHDVFDNDTSFTTLNIGNQVKTIPENAFCFCKYLTSVTIPNSVTTIGEGAFWFCEGLTSITISNSVTTIGERAFAVCESLTSIVIPNSVTSIGYNAFAQCISLISVSLPNNLTSIAEGTFRYCPSLTSISIPNSVTSIGKGAFNECLSLTSVTIPDNVTIIGESAFQECRNLISIIIPESCTNIERSAFRGCMGLTSITNFNPVPVEIVDWTVFQHINKSACTLKVPTYSVSAYQNAYEWKEFNIVGI